MSSDTPPPDQGPFSGAPQQARGEGPPGVFATPLQADDPPRVGDFWLDARLTGGPAGVGYLGHSDDETAVLLLMLSAGAAQDAAARERLAGEVNMLHIDTVVARGGQGQGEGRLGHTFRAEDGDPVGPGHAPLAPWVALVHDGSAAAVAEADRLLASVDLSTRSLQGAPDGPAYRLHWIDDTRPGTSRLWPLPWPGRHDRAGWVTILISWLLTLLLAALALLIAVLLFQNAPPQPPEPPVPTSPPPSGSGSGSGSPPPSSGSPSSGSPSSGSGSPESASASPSDSSGVTGKPSDSPSMESPDPSGSASGVGGSPPPNEKL